MGNTNGGKNRCAGMYLFAALVLPGVALAGDLERQCRLLQVDALLSTAVFSCEKQIISVASGGKFRSYTVGAINTRHVVLNGDSGTVAIWHVGNSSSPPRIDYFHPALQKETPATFTTATHDETDAETVSERAKP